LPAGDLIVRMNKTQLYTLIQEEIQESIRSSYQRMKGYQQLADSLKQLEKVMIHLLRQKQNNEPGTVEHDKAKEQLARIAAVAQEYAYRSER